MCWQLSRSSDNGNGSDNAEGRVQQQEGRWQPWKSCTTCAAKGAVLCTGGQYEEAQQKTVSCYQTAAEDMRYKLAVQAFIIASHHLTPSALRQCQQNIEAPQGSLAHLAQAVPSSVTACLTSTWVGFVLVSTADGM